MKVENIPSQYDSEASRWAAVQARDAGADGVFWYSVKSTGVYCRPSCAARPALRRNVAFHDSRSDAEGAGFRPCLRCKPDQPPLAERHAELVARACRLIDASEGEPDLDTLAQASAMSRFHFHRIFKAYTGITPKAYAVAGRAPVARVGGGADGDRRHLRCRIRLERALLCGRVRPAGDDAWALPRRW